VRVSARGGGGGEISSSLVALKVIHQSKTADSSGGVGVELRDVVQHRVTASFDVVFEESGDAGMFSSDDHRVQQQAAANLDERHSCLKHGGNGICTVSGYTANAQARGLCAKHEGKGMCTVTRARL
jgi:hypothetical protein